MKENQQLSPLLKDYQNSPVNQRLADNPQFDTRGMFDSVHCMARELFYHTFKEIPNVIRLIDLNTTTLSEHIESTFKERIIDFRYSRKEFGKKGLTLADVFYFIEPGILINIDHRTEDLTLLFSNASETVALAMIQNFQTHTLSKNKYTNYLGLIVDENGLTTNYIPIKKRSIELDMNYTSDLAEVHQTILTRLDQNEDKGIVLLYGKPGTGKTSYIRHLIGEVNKKVIYMSPELAKNISGPQMLSFLTNHSNEVLIIEDAENLITQRSHSSNSAISALLNLSDGLLADCLNIQVVCTFNTDLKNIDSALLRKGRLIAKHEFKYLPKHQATTLSKELGHGVIYDQEASLAEIYHPNDADFMADTLTKKIGF